MAINSLVVRSTVVGALGGLVFGFDTAVISGTTAALTRTYHLSPLLLGITVSSAMAGTVVAALTSGIPGQKFGRRSSLRVMAAFYVVAAIGCGLAWNWGALVAFRLIAGLGIGGTSVLAPMYIAEISPPRWRGRTVGFFQVNIVSGILLAYFSNYMIGLAHLGTHEWRWQLGISGIPAACFLAALFFIPRSPRWLATQGLLEPALDVLRNSGVEDPRAELDGIVSSLRRGSASVDRLFTRQYAKPVFLAITVGAFCQLTGISAVLYYMNEIFSLAGAGEVSANLQAIAVGATNLIATLVGMAMIDHFGRRKLLLFGTAGLAVVLGVISTVFMSGVHLDWLVWLLLVYVACFAVSQGAVTWVYVAEVFPTRVRSKGQSLGASSHWITNTIIALAFPVVAASSGAYPFIFFGAMMVLDFFVILFFYPETKGVSLEQVQHKLGI